MPLYEYRCANCGAKFEQLRRMQDADKETACPQCDSVQVKRELSVFASQMGSSSGSGESAPCGAPASACGSNRFR